MRTELHQDIDKPKSPIGNNQISFKRIDFLDGWRGLSIALVLQSHFLTIYEIGTGGLGVDMFFALSGMLMSKILFVKRTPLPIFFERRINRILPTFVLFVVSAFTIGAITGKAINFSEFISTITFFRTYYPIEPNIWHTTLPIGHLWSLNVEEHSYIFMGILTLIAYIKKREGLALICIGMSAILIMAFYAVFPDIAPGEAFMRTECAASFIMISAGYSLIKDKYARFVTPIMPVITFAVTVWIYSKWYPFRGYLYLAPFLLSFTVNHLSETYEPVLKMLSYRPLRLLGLWSYSLYLWQQPFFVYRTKFYPGFLLVPALIIGVASFYLYENPIRQWLNKRRLLSLGYASLKRAV